eukprot:4913872-Pyramimonas_sp.AAC.1
MMAMVGAWCNLAVRPKHLGSSRPGASSILLVFHTHAETVDLRVIVFLFRGMAVQKALWTVWSAVAFVLSLSVPTANSIGVSSTLKCADDDAQIIALASGIGVKISGCAEVKPYCKDAAYGST